jgi:hypothetical protein
VRSGEDRGVTAKDGSGQAEGQGQVGLISEVRLTEAPRLMENVEGLKLESSTQRPREKETRRENGRVDGRGGRGSVWRQDRDGRPKEDKNDRDGAGRRKTRATRWREQNRTGPEMQQMR